VEVFIVRLLAKLCWVLAGCSLVTMIVSAFSVDFMVMANTPVASRIFSGTMCMSLAMAVAGAWFLSLHAGWLAWTGWRRRIDSSGRLKLRHVPVVIKKDEQPAAFWACVLTMALVTLAALLLALAFGLGWVPTPPPQG